MAIVLRTTGFESRVVIHRLAEQYGWPVIVGTPPIATGFSIEFERDCLQLRDLANPKMLPLIVDFLSPKMRHRRSQAGHRSQPFAKALGVGSRPGRKVIDATAGLGVDAFMMVCLGCEVTAIERSPVIFELLMDGYRRAMTDIEIGELIRENLKVVEGHAAEYLLGLPTEQRPHVIYLDPMYPEVEGKTSLPKKEMQVFRKLVGSDEDSAEIFRMALVKATERVVVKRPLRATPIQPHPTHTFAGKTARYDMYSI